MPLPAARFQSGSADKKERVTALPPSTTSTAVESPCRSARLGDVELFDTLAQKRARAAFESHRNKIANYIETLVEEVSFHSEIKTLERLAMIRECWPSVCTYPQSLIESEQIWTQRM